MSITTTLVRTTVCVLCWAILFTSCVRAQNNASANREKEKFLAEAGSIEGAIWSYELKPKPGSKKNAVAISGRYRVSDLKIYQAERKGGEMTRQIGVSKPIPKQKVTVAEFESLRGATGPERIIETIKGKALLTSKGFGELEGEFIDSEGFKWEMILKRVRE